MFAIFLYLYRIRRYPNIPTNPKKSRYFTILSSLNIKAILLTDSYMLMYFFHLKIFGSVFTFVKTLPKSVQILKEKKLFWQWWLLSLLVFFFKLMSIILIQTKNISNINFENLNCIQGFLSIFFTSFDGCLIILYLIRCSTLCTLLNI